jgi:hypothetical protein
VPKAGTVEAGCNDWFDASNEQPFENRRGFMSRGRVLLLEDDVALRGLLQEALGTEDFEVVSCDTYGEARRRWWSRTSGAVVSGG